MNETWKSRLWSFAKYGGRLVVIALMVAMIASTARTYYRWLQPTPELAAATPVAPPLPIEVLHSLPADGYWTFQETPWRFRQTEVRATDFEDHLKGLAGAATGSDGPTELDDAILPILDTAKVIGHPVTPDVQNYPVAGPITMHFLVRQLATRRQVLAVLLEVPSESGPMILELSLRGPEVDADSKAHLLPLPSTASRMMARWSDEGDLVLECVSVAQPLEDLKRQWIAEDPSIHELDANLGEIEGCLLERRRERIFVFRTSGSGDSLVLVKLPS
ncbi:hypothetical protein LOC68_09535 [Blastopirellula sp. JC732]|uniref:Uncharacterized protein n=1 Tax=Blastopirellula sediminis TaxID=2894196 RepID=A0A9X1MNC9_9BACT|nr:hypothetical protein [Blastopirellula sediminis]MCC9608584.1 hypothetical protein [Blastopirellula sediminis]MCC9628639.1 hypothetical protein [Blastopirellula sediminis]